MRISESSFIIFKCRSGRSVGIAVETAMRASVVSADVFRENAAARLALAAVGLGVIKEVFAKWHHRVQDGRSAPGRCSGYAQCHNLKDQSVRRTLRV